MRKIPPGSSRCKCRGDTNETLPHLLNHCPPLRPLIRERYNAILSHLAKAISNEHTVFKEQTVPGDNHLLKPDLIVVNPTEKKGYIIDVTVPFESGPRPLTMLVWTKRQSMIT
jgi:hypothetical protein